MQARYFLVIVGSVAALALFLPYIGYGYVRMTFPVKLGRAWRDDSRLTGQWRRPERPEQPPSSYG